MGNSIFENEKTTERTLIESILSSFYIIDYGFIKAVNPDKTINVIHAKQLKTYDGTSLKSTITENVEVLTLAGAGFAFKFDYKKGDKVMLLGLKDYIKRVDEVTSASETTTYFHYTRETLKALPLCVFNDKAKVKVDVEGGTMKVTTEKKIELNGSSKQFVTWAELNQALQGLITALNSHTHSNGNEGSPTGAPIAPLTLDISASKTSTIVTGG